LESGWDYVNTFWDDVEPEEWVEECEAELDWVNFGDDLVHNPEHREYVNERQRGARWHTFRQEIDWVIVGGESGPGCRMMDLEWAQQIVELCKDMGAGGLMRPAVFVKQLGGWPDRRTDMSQWPEGLRVREWPE
jgi:protein gp37